MADQILIELARETLQKKGVDPHDERALLAVVEAGEQMKLVHYAAILLRDVGTVEAVPALKKAMSHPKQDVKTTALCTLAEIARESDASVYGGFLTDKRYREKWAALYAPARYGDRTAVPDILNRLKKLLARKERLDWGKETEVVLAAKYLARFDDDPAARTGLDLIAANWNKLNPPEQEEIKATILQLQQEQKKMQRSFPLNQKMRQFQTLLMKIQQLAVPFDKPASGEFVRAQESKFRRRHHRRNRN